jgi:hypothetical protein
MTAIIHFAAFVEPKLVHIFEYVRDSAAIEVLRHETDSGDWTAAPGAAAALAGLVRRAAGRKTRASVVAVVRGFDVHYRLLRLPPAAPDVLRLVVEREMRRLHPEIEDAVVDFAVSGYAERRGLPAQDNSSLPDRRQSDVAVPPAEILAAAAPAAVVKAFTDALDEHGIVLEHLTIPAQAVARLYEQVNGNREATAIALMLPGGPFVAFFQNGELRFVTEPPAPMHESVAALQTAIDQLSRGRIYMRQQFRGADVTRVLLAAQPEEQSHLDSALTAVLEVDVEGLPVSVGSPAAVAALGAALDAASGDGLSFHPSAHARQLAIAHGRFRTAMLATAAVAAVAVAAALFAVATAQRAATRLEDTRRRTAAEVATVQAISAVVSNRRDNRDRLRAVADLAAGRQTLARVLQGIVRAAPPPVTVSRIALSRDSGPWRAEVSGISTGLSTAGALRGVSVFQQELPRVLPSAEVEVVDFDQAADDSGVNFRLVVTLPNGAPPAP